MGSRASFALGSVYWLARAALRHKLNKGLAARFEHGCQTDLRGPQPSMIAEGKLPAHVSFTSLCFPAAYLPPARAVRAGMIHLN